MPKYITYVTADKQWHCRRVKGKETSMTKIHRGYRGAIKTRMDAIKRYFNGYDLREAPKGFAFTTTRGDEKKASSALAKGQRRELCCTGCQAIIRQFPGTAIGDVMLLKTRAYVKLPAGYFGIKKECVWHFKIGNTTRINVVDNFDSASSDKNSFEPNIYMLNPPPPSNTFAGQVEFNRNRGEWKSSGNSHHGRPDKYPSKRDKQSGKVKKTLRRIAAKSAARTSRPWQWRFDKP